MITLRYLQRSAECVSWGFPNNFQGVAGRSFSNSPATCLLGSCEIRLSLRRIFGDSRSKLLVYGPKGLWGICNKVSEKKERQQSSDAGLRGMFVLIGGLRRTVYEVPGENAWKWEWEETKNKNGSEEYVDLLQDWERVLGNSTRKSS